MSTWTRIGEGMLAGLVATIVLSLLVLTRSVMPQLDTVTMLDTVATRLLEAGGLSAPPLVGWLWHFLIGTVWWGSLYSILTPILPGRKCWTKGVYFGFGAGLLVLLMVMPLAAAGYFGMELGPLDPVVTIILHLIYGGVLGVSYGLMRRSASCAT